MFLTAVLLLKGVIVGETAAVGVPVGWAVSFLELFLPLCLALATGVVAGLTLVPLGVAVESARLI
jgi:hypothetical protein